MVDSKVSTLGSRAEHGTFSPAGWTSEVSNRKGRKRKLKTHCIRGHEYTPENTGKRSDGRGRYCKKCLASGEKKRLNKGDKQVGCKPHGIPFRQCKECQRASQQKSDRKRYAKRVEWRAMSISESLLVKEALVYNSGLATIEDGADIKKNALDVFKLTKEQAETQEPLQFELDRKGRPKCEENPEAYFFEPDATVTDQYAEEMCNGCPLMGSGLCLDYAKTYASPYQVMVAEGKVLMGTTIRVRGE